jgi:hypothetical protein
MQIEITLTELRDGNVLSHPKEIPTRRSLLWLERMSPHPAPKRSKM